MFLPVRYVLLETRSFHPFQIGRHLIFELICESIPIDVLLNPDSIARLLINEFEIETSQYSVASP